MKQADWENAKKKKRERERERENFWKIYVKNACLINSYYTSSIYIQDQLVIEYLHLHNSWNWSKKIGGSWAQQLREENWISCLIPTVFWLLGTTPFCVLH